jgi:hypothetical protein
MIHTYTTAMPLNAQCTSAKTKGLARNATNHGRLFRAVLFKTVSQLNHVHIIYSVALRRPSVTIEGLGCNKHCAVFRQPTQHLCLNTTIRQPPRTSFLAATKRRQQITQPPRTSLYWQPQNKMQRVAPKNHATRYEHLCKLAGLAPGATPLRNG